jgi:hypothetical protein
MTDEPDSGIVVSGIRAIAGDDAGETLSLLRNPVAYIMGAVATWVVKNVFIGPSTWLLAMIDTAFASLRDAWATVDTTVDGALSTAGAAFVNGPEMAIQALATAIESAGLAAPLATTIATMLFVAVVAGVLVLLVRILVDIVPGGGAFL